MAILGPKFVCLIFLVLGCIFLQPFNTIVNLYDYYEHQDLPLPTSSYISLLNAIFQISSITTNAGILLFPKPSPFKQKEIIVLYISTTITIILFILLAIFTTLNIKGISYLILSLIFSCIFSITSSINDNLNLFLVAKVSRAKPLLPYLTGINITGTFNSLILLLIQLLSTDYVLVARFYFSITACVIALAIPIYRHIFKSEVTTSNEEIAHIAASETTKARIIRIVKVIYPYTALVFLNFTVTLFIYPQMALRANPPVNSPIYHTVIVFFLFNLSALCGNLLALKFPSSNTLKVYLILLSRLIFSVPFFVCYQINFTYDILSSYVAICVVLTVVIITFTGFTSGYLASCAFYGAGKCFLNLQDKVIALRMVNFALSLGLTLGAGLSYVFLFFINKK